MQCWKPSKQDRHPNIRCQDLSITVFICVILHIISHLWGLGKSGRRREQWGWFTTLTGWEVKTCEGAAVCRGCASNCNKLCGSLLPFGKADSRAGEGAKVSTTTPQSSPPGQITSFSTYRSIASNTQSPSIQPFFHNSLLLLFICHPINSQKAKLNLKCRISIYIWLGFLRRWGRFSVNNPH